MKRLYLVRHGDAGGGAGGDHERPLAPSGARQAGAVGRFMLGRGLSADLALASTALRARQTLDGILGVLPDAIPVRYDERFYLSAAEELVGILRTQDDAEALLCVGHNPGLGTLARILARPGAVVLPPGALARGALAVLDLSIAGWADLGPHTARLADYFAPAGS